MAVKIRLTRKGKKKQPFYRVVVANGQNPRDGQALEIVGVYDPTKDPIYFEINQERVAYWLSVGAQPSDTVQRLLSRAEVLPPIKRQSANQGVARKKAS